jgi:amidase
MKRRHFLSTAAAGAGAIGIPMVSSCTRPAETGKTEPAFTDEFELKEASLASLRNDMNTGKYTSQKITEMYIDRINRIDRNGPGLNSVIELNPDAITIAASLDKEFKEGKLRGPLHGIPVLIKDNIDTADRMSTTAGSMALEGSIAAKDAFIVRLLRETGAVILGKTNLSEWANFRSSRSSSGWSGRGGQTRNPYVLDRNPCGSSSGSAVAVSANLCGIAIGTETDGSIVCPSNANGIVGIKPTVGLWSRAGIIPFSRSQDTAGPMARSVSDAAILLGLLTGVDEQDEATKASEGKSLIDYTRFLDPTGLKGARIGVLRSYFGFHPEVDKRMEESIAAMRAQGAEIIDPVEINTMREIDAPEFEVLLYEFKAGLNAYLSGMSPEIKCRSLANLIFYNEASKDTEMPWFGQEIFIQADQKGPLTEQKYLDALSNAKRLAGKEGIDAALAEHRLDALVAPTGGPAWTTDWVNGDHFGGGSSSVAAVAGYPAITVPAGFVHGLPVGISFMASAWSESKLISLAFSFEQATRHRKPPSFLPSVKMIS